MILEMPTLQNLSSFEEFGADSGWCPDVLFYPT